METADLLHEVSTSLAEAGAMVSNAKALDICRKLGGD
jgi:hypothetical protein